ncbi:hypothetical protein JNW90_26120 [Micromonospora sp. STR1s_5]|nr:hypothetical protein [Micromonospora sp. STR1s_5]
MTPGEAVKLEGDGPYELPLIEDVDLAVGELLAVLKLTTKDGKVLYLPLGAQSVADLHELTGQAMAVFGREEGDTLQ